MDSQNFPLCELFLACEHFLSCGILISAFFLIQNFVKFHALTPTFEPVRRPSPAYGLPRGNLVAGGCRQGGRERARVSEQTRTARSGCAQRDARVSHLARLAAVGLALAPGALQQYVPFPKVYEVCL